MSIAQKLSMSGLLVITSLLFVDGISNQTILRANIAERALQLLGEYIRTKIVPKLV